MQREKPRSPRDVNRSKYLFRKREAEQRKYALSLLDDPPLNSKMAIYRSGRRSQKVLLNFLQNTSPNWVPSVALQYSFTASSLSHPLPLIPLWYLSVYAPTSVCKVASQVHTPPQLSCFFIVAPSFPPFLASQRKYVLLRWCIHTYARLIFRFATDVALNITCSSGSINGFSKLCPFLTLYCVGGSSVRK